jgi:hypothetical protein
MPKAVVVLSLLSLLIASRTADACSCCDWSLGRTPIGWTRAGGAVLIDMSSNAACSKTHLLEVWTIGAAEPAGCYDLLEDPEARVECGIGASGFSAPERPSSQVKRFATKAIALPASSVRLRKQPIARREELRVTVEVLTKRGWRRLWSSTVHSIEEFTDPAGVTQAMPLDVTVWPNPRGDRALVLIANDRQGSGWPTTVHWAEIPPDAVVR